MALTRARKEEIAVTLTLTGQGDTIKFDVVFFNRRQSEVEQKLKEAREAGDPNSVDPTAKVMVFMVKALPDSEYPCTLEGFLEMEDDRPGTLMGIIEAFHEARMVAKEKN